MYPSCPLEPVDGKRDFAGVTPFGILTWGHEPGLCRWAQRHHKCPYKGRRGAQSPRNTCGHGSRSQRGERTMACWVRRGRNGSAGQGRRTALDAGKGKAPDCPPSLQKYEARTALHLSPVVVRSDFSPPGRRECRPVLFPVTQRVALCDSSCRRLTHTSLHTQGLAMKCVNVLQGCC